MCACFLGAAEKEETVFFDMTVAFVIAWQVGFDWFRSDTCCPGVFVDSLLLCVRVDNDEAALRFLAFFFTPAISKNEFLSRSVVSAVHRNPNMNT